jgi:hypothetical protein
VEDRIEQDDPDRADEPESSNDHQHACRRGRGVRFHHPHRVRLDTCSDRLVEGNVGIADAPISPDLDPNGAVAAFEDGNPPEASGSALADVDQGGTRDVRSTDAAHPRRVRVEPDALQGGLDRSRDLTDPEPEPHAIALELPRNADNDDTGRA